MSGLGSLTSLCMLQLHRPNVPPIIKSTDAEVWQQAINAKELNQTSAPLFFAIVKSACNASKQLSDTQEVKNFMEAFRQKSAINQVNKLLDEILFTDSAFKDQQGPFFNVLKSWLNLAYPFYKDRNMQEAAAVQVLSMRVLHNADNVRAVWAEYSLSKDNLVKSLQMFETVLRNPVPEI